MTPDRALRLAAEPVQLPERRLELIPALSTTSRIARDHGITSQAHGGAGSHELRLPGIGGRYLAGIATHVAAQGWPAADAGALVAALEDRSRDVGRVLVRCGPRPSGPGARRAARAQGGCDPFQWRPVGPRPDSGGRHGRRPHAGRHRSGRGVRGGRVGPAAAVELRAGSGRGRSAHGIHGTGAGASARTHDGRSSCSSRRRSRPARSSACASRSPRRRAVGGAGRRCVGSICRRCAPAIRT